MGKDTLPLTPDEMAAELKRFAETSAASSAARQYRYQQSEKASGALAMPEPEKPVRSLTFKLPQNSRYSWICSSCGSVHTDAEIGNIHQSRFHFNDLIIAECPSCHGALHNIAQLRKMEADEKLAQARELRLIRRSRLATIVAFIFYLMFPGVIEFMTLLTVVLWIGPLRRLDVKTKCGALIIAGAFSVINTFTFGALGMGFVDGTSRILSYCMALIISAVIVAMALVIDRAGRFGGGLFSRS